MTDLATVLAYDAGVEAERERIIHYLIYNQESPLIRAMQCTTNGIHPIDELTLRKALKP